MSFSKYLFFFSENFKQLIASHSEYKYLIYVKILRSEVKIWAISYQVKIFLFFKFLVMFKKIAQIIILIYPSYSTRDMESSFCIVRPHGFLFSLQMIYRIIFN